MACSMVAGGGACCRLGWLVGRGGGTAAADRPPLLAPDSWGAGVVLQVVADIYLPYFIPPGDPGGEGLGEKLPTRSIANSGPKPLAMKVDWLLRKVDWLLKEG
jgi:hypothetical protein